jgi:general secretion pathway protein J
MRRASEIQSFGQVYRAAGFTLMEVLLAMTISSLLVVSIVSGTRTILRARQQVDRRVERVTEIRHAMATLVGALRNVRFDRANDRPGVFSLENSGINLQVYSDHRVRLQGAESDQYEVGFCLIKRPGDRWPVLVSRRDHALDDDAESGGLVDVVAEGIVDLIFEYYADGEWRKEWEPAERTPPQAVRVTLAAVDPQADPSEEKPDTLVLSTVVPIRVTVKGAVRPGGSEQ